MYRRIKEPNRAAPRINSHAGMNPEEVHNA